MANTNISELVKTIGSIAYEIQEEILFENEEIREAQVQASEAMNIVGLLLLENGINPLTTDALHEFDGYVLENGNREIIPEEELSDHVARRIDLAGLRNGIPFISIDLDVAKKDYHEVKFKGTTHYILRANGYRMI